MPLKTNSIKMPEIMNNKRGLEFNEKFVLAYDLMENSQKHAFITGKAGTGKSTLLEFFRDTTIKNIVVLAPTGVAAVNVKGQTIHSFFRFKPDITPDSVQSIRIPKAKKEIYKRLDTIVIDEVSMVRADLLDCVDVFLRIHGRNRHEAFGGAQIVFIGDLYQLPPVVTRHDEELFQGHYASPYFFDSKIFKFLNGATPKRIEYIEFEKVYRQKDEAFIQLLNSIRDRSADADILKILNKRYQPKFEPAKDDYYIYLTTTNAMADRVNQQQLNNLEGKIQVFEGEMTGEFNEKNLPTSLSLCLKPQAQVMMLNNDTKGRWVNGTIGKIVSIHAGLDNKEAIQVELLDGKVVDVAPFTWEIYRFFFNEAAQMVQSESIGSFTQYPLRLAWAITIHKSQGKTFPKVIVDVGEGTFAHGQIYVALSRCTNFEGLILKRPIQRHHIILDESICEFHSMLS